MIIYITRANGSLRRVVQDTYFKRGPAGGMLIMLTEPVKFHEGESITSIYTTKFEEEKDKNV